LTGPLAPPPATAQPRIEPPLHTIGCRILDSKGAVVRLASVNWHGFDQKKIVAVGLDHAPLGSPHAYAS
jgi:hypothetical protein